MATAAGIKRGTLKAVEDRGIIRNLSYTLNVSGVTDTDEGAIAQILNATSVPAVGESPENYSNLVCTKRVAKVVDGEQSRGEVDLEFERKSEVAFIFWSGLGVNSGSLFVFSGGTSLVQDITQLNGYGNQVSVSHTFPSDDDDYPSETKTQGADVPVRTPRSTVTARGLLRTGYPDVIASAFTGYINSTWWAGKAPYTWQCSSVTWDPVILNTSPRVFEFTFTFEYNPFTHMPFVYYRDERTGRAPANLVPNTGMGYVDFYPAMNFNYFFPV